MHATGQLRNPRPSVVNSNLRWKQTRRLLLEDPQVPGAEPLVFTVTLSVAVLHLMRRLRPERMPSCPAMRRIIKIPIFAKFSEFTRITTFAETKTYFAELPFCSFGSWICSPRPGHAEETAAESVARSPKPQSFSGIGPQCASARVKVQGSVNQWGSFSSGWRAACNCSYQPSGSKGTHVLARPP